MDEDAERKKKLELARKKLKKFQSKGGNTQKQSKTAGHESIPTSPVSTYSTTTENNGNQNSSESLFSSKPIIESTREPVLVSAPSAEQIQPSSQFQFEQTTVPYSSVKTPSLPSKSPIQSPPLSISQSIFSPGAMNNQINSPPPLPIPPSDTYIPNSNAFEYTTPTTSPKPFQTDTQHLYQRITELETRLNQQITITTDLSQRLQFQTQTSETAQSLRIQIEKTLDSVILENQTLKQQHVNAVLKLNTVESENVGLKQQVKDLNERLQSANSENTSLADVIVGLKRENSEQTLSLSLLNEQLKILKEEGVQSRSNSESELNIKQREWEIERNQLVNDFESLKKQLMKANERVVELASQSDDNFVMEKEKMDGMVKQVVAEEMKKWELEQIALVDEIEQLNVEKSAMATSLEQLDQLKIDKLQLLDRTQELEEVITDLQNTRVKLQSEIKILTSSYAQSEKKLETMTLKIEQLESLLTKSQNEETQLKSVKDLLLTSFNESQATTEKLESHISLLNSKLNTSAEEKSLLENNVKSLQSQLSVTKQELSVAESELRTTSTKLLTLQQQQQQYKPKLEPLSTNSEPSTAPWVSQSSPILPSAEYVNLAKLSATLQTQRDELSAQLTTALSNLESANIQLESLKSASHERDILIHQTQDLQSQIETIEKKLTREQQNAEYREQSLQSQIQILQMLESELNEIKSREGSELSILQWVLDLISRNNELKQSLNDAHECIDLQHMKLESLLNSNGAEKNEVNRTIEDSVKQTRDVDVQTDTMNSFKRLSTLKKEFLIQNVPTKNKNSTEYEDLVGRFVNLQQLFNVTKSQLDFQFQVNVEIKRMIVDFGGDEGNYLERYNSVLGELGRVTEELERWKVRCEEVEEVVENAVLKKLEEEEKLQLVHVECEVAETENVSVANNNESTQEDLLLEIPKIN